MTPLEIQLLLNLYCRAQPYDGYPVQERFTPAMRDAFKKFRDLGLLAEGVTYTQVMVDHDDQEQFLSAKGMILVERLMEVQP
jgi:hypothetical protein